MTQVATDIDWSQYEGKRVELVYNPAGESEAVQVEVLVKGYGQGSLLVKPKGKQGLAMYSVADIEPGSVHLVETEKKIKASSVLPIKLGKARTHLLERHGITLGQANGMTEEQAFEYHEGLDHVDLDLGHVHDKAEKSDDSE